VLFAAFNVVRFFKVSTVCVNLSLKPLSTAQNRTTDYVIWQLVPDNILPCHILDIYTSFYFNVHKKLIPQQNDFKHHEYGGIQLTGSRKISVTR